MTALNISNQFISCSFDWVFVCILACKFQLVWNPFETFISCQSYSLTQCFDNRTSTKQFIVNLKQLSTTSHHESEMDSDVLLARLGRKCKSGNKRKKSYTCINIGEITCVNDLDGCVVGLLVIYKSTHNQRISCMSLYVN